MRVLLTTIGSQGDVRPLVAMASRLRESGHGAHLCVSPDLRDWVEGPGFPFTPSARRCAGWWAHPCPSRLDPRRRRRVGELGIGVAHEHGTPTADSLIAALRLALQLAVTERARSLSAVVTTGGAQAAAADLATLTAMPEGGPSAERDRIPALGQSLGTVTPITSNNRLTYPAGTVSHQLRNL